MRKFNIRKVLDGLTAVSSAASASSAAQQQQAGNRESEIQETLQSEHFQLCKVNAPGGQGEKQAGGLRGVRQQLGRRGAGRDAHGLGGESGVEEGGLGEGGMPGGIAACQRELAGPEERGLGRCVPGNAAPRCPCAWRGPETFVVLWLRCVAKSPGLLLQRFSRDGGKVPFFFFFFHLFARDTITAVSARTLLENDAAN